MTIDPEVLKSVMRNWTSGIAVVTCGYEGYKHGMTVNSFTSVSISPALIVVSLENKTRTCKLVKRSQQMGITILSEKQKEISDRFAGKVSEDKDRFSGLEILHLDSETPFLVDGLAWLDCVVRNEINLGASTLFIAEVMVAKVGFGEPLLYHNRDYYRLGKKHD
jgi:flavin reductase (DIM6/NTAB) family NADH-FMN oxidoreductase RutF